MSLQKKIGRWKRFEIAFTEGKWAQISFLHQAEETQTLDEMRELRKIEEKLDEKKNPNPRPAAERNASTTKTARLDDSTLKAAFEPASKSLWTEARREKAEELKRRAEATLKSTRQEKGSAETSEFPTPKRSRTFRLCEPPRRFDRPCDE